jgi:hypothetical protein
MLEQPLQPASEQCVVIDEYHAGALRLLRKRP